MKEYINADQIKGSLANTPQITFETTDACNLSCEYCGYGKFYSDHDKRENRNLDIDIAKRFLDYVAGLWGTSLNRSMHNNLYLSFYGGEPLLNFQFIEEMVYYAKSIAGKQRRFTFNMTTNGLLLDRYIDFLVLNDFGLLVSLDGDELCNSYRVDKNNLNSFRHVINNVNSIRRLYPDYFSKRVNFNSVLHNRNTVKGIYDFFKVNYGKAPSIGALNDMGIKDEMKEEFMRMYRNPIDSLFQSENYGEIETEMFLSSPTYHSATVFLMQYSEFKYENYNELLYGKAISSKTFPTGTCLPFSKKVFVTVNGKILPCERIGQQFAVGFIDKEKICIDFELIAKKYNQYYSKLDSLCSKCLGARSCIQCIFNLEDIEKQKCGCHGFMNQEKFDAYRNSQLGFLARHPDAYSKIMNDVIYR